MKKPPKKKPPKKTVRIGPPKGSLNALRTGASLGRDGLVIGNIPIKSVRDQARAYRRQLVAVVLQVRGYVEYVDLSATDKHGIHAATTAVAHGAICRWLLRTKLKGMPTADVRATSKEIKAAASDAAREVRALNLDAPPPSPWAAIDATVVDARGNGDSADD